MKIKYILQLEGAAILSLAIYLFAKSNGSWWMFGLLLLSTDLAMILYLFGLKIGTFSYNLVHNYILPVGMVIFGLHFANELAVQLSLIWFAHIGMDKMVGYGLKYSTGFKHTHFEKV